MRHHPAKIFELVCSCSGVRGKDLLTVSKYRLKKHAQTALVYLLGKYSNKNFKQIGELTGIGSNFVVVQGERIKRLMEIRYEDHMLKPDVKLILEIEKYLEPI